ncbi:MAG: hypothetical protein QNK05_12395 [Myxococcota bacterium]|nr:hypothetical protein [Myxococcota bacterium]
MAERRLVFVYNVDGTPMALLRDLYLATTTGSTDCSLCDVTFGRLLKKPEWAAFVASLPLPVEFRLRSTFRRRHPDVAGPFPAGFLVEEDGRLERLFSAEEIDAAGDLDALRSLVGDRLRARGLVPVAAGELATP